ncbi:MAG: heparinase II/III family protein [Polaromonas sp.]
MTVKHPIYQSLLRWAAAVAIIVLLLEPMVWRGLIRVDAPPLHQIEVLKLKPEQSRLKEIASYNLQDIPMPSGIDAIRMADRLLDGKDFMQDFSGVPYALPFTEKARQSDLVRRRQIATDTREPVIYQLPFAERDLLRGDGIGGLPYASLYLADVMLNAYATSADEKYLAAARDIILAFSRFERSHWLSIGFLWNDHALATRAGVLARFWSAYRVHALYTDSEMRELLVQVARTAALLAAPRDFNVRTNHGVMQNVALMQLLLAFPGLNDAKSYWSIARNRVKSQIAFLYADDGFVLEHSAHYHELGVRLLAMAIRLVELAGEPVPPSWTVRLADASARLVDITRPDGTLPAYGDTELEFWAERGARPTLQNQSAGFHVFPLSGYAITGFSGVNPSHTVTTWSYFPGHGHKLADELSILIWAQGRGLLTNTGYWDYSSWGRQYTESWLGGNAPHWLGETAQQSRESHILTVANNTNAGYVELERSNADGTRFVRETLALDAGLWLIVDHAQGKAGDQTETLWTFFPDMTLAQAQSGSYLVSDKSDAQLVVAMRSTSPLRIEQHKGSRAPFAGWVTMGREGVPAPALRVLATAGASTATIFGNEMSFAQNFTFESAKDGEWQAQGEGWRARREGAHLKFEISGRSEVLTLDAPPDVSAQRETILANYAQALARYPREPNLDSYRKRLLKLLLILFAMQELSFALLPRLGRLTAARAHSLNVSVAVAVLWIATGLWLHLHYLRI